MPSLKDIRARINSVSSTMQITSTMKLVAVAKLKKSQDAITNLQPYASKLKSLIEGLQPEAETSANFPLLNQRPVKKVLLVAISSNRGLCGAFNANIIKRTQAEVDRLESEGKEVVIYTIGKKINDYFAKQRQTTSYEDLHDNTTFEKVEVLANQIIEQYEKEDYDQVSFVYHQFISSAKQETTTEQLLPLQAETPNQNPISTIDYIYEPQEEELLKLLTPKSVKVQVYKMLLASIASEHSFRMLAMHQATDNATALKKDLTLTYNKLRQAAITNEILEIVGGAEALNS